ncbi:MAG: glyoxylase-like metal-dependent hydrolase (beta-lactamase superfamily II) [Gammaproteobacteria bacterium]|jgi:glyoxylase-like metal-dependent hydrolase (beta-lactamase superfamily II)
MQLYWIVLSLALITTGCSKQSAKLPEAVEQVGEGVFLFTHDDERSLFLVDTEGVIVTDPLGIDAAPKYKRAIAAITDAPVKYVVYSHYHWDRVAGAEVFLRDGAEVIAQESCAERFSVNPNPDVVTPDITFETDYVVKVGDQQLGLNYFGPSHSDCMTVFTVEKQGLMQIVDLVNPPAAAFPENPTIPYIRPHNLREFFQRTIEFAAERNIDTVVASRVMPDAASGAGSSATGPVSLVNDQAAFWNAIFEQSSSVRAAGGVGIDGLVRLEYVDLDQFDDYAGYRKEDLPSIMRRVFSYYDMGR